MGIEFKDEIFMYEENARKDSTGCLSVIMHQKLLEGREEAGISYLLLRVREAMSIIPKKTKKNIFFLLSLEHPYQASFKLFLYWHTLRIKLALGFLHVAMVSNPNLAFGQSLFPRKSRFQL